MKHFVCFPSASTEKGLPCAGMWGKKGYIPVVMHGQVQVGVIWKEAMLLSEPIPFPGYYRVINNIVGKAFGFGADLVTCIGDDMDPPAQGADWVAKKYFKRFPNGEGVMQGTGDTQGDMIDGVHASARICGSPTFGREWATGAYGGYSPFHEGYRSFYGDEDLWNVAKRRGLLWLNPEITILHRHWSWGHMKRQPYHEKAQENWNADHMLFQERKSAGFP